MSQAGTAFIPFEGDFSNVLSDARRYGVRAGSMFGSDFGSRADKAMGSSFRGTTSDMEKSSGRAGSRAGSDYGRDFGRQAERGMGGSLKKIAGGLTTAFALVKGVQIFGDMIDEGREAAKIGRITNNVIKQTGGVAKISASEVGDLSTALSNKAGMDDELIQSGANLLLTFKQIRNEVGAGNQIFDRATAAAVDMSVQFGSVESTSKMLGKALNDPVKGISALGRAGVTFSEDQKTAIKSMVATNDVLGAQKIILGEVESQVGGAAAAAADPLDRLTVAWGNLLELGGSKVLPWAGEVADGLVNFLPDAVGTAERVIGQLVDRGTDLASAFWDKVEPAAEDVWSSLQNLWEIGQDVVEIGQPIAKALALVGGAGVLGAITGTAAALESVTGFLADNEELVRLLMAGVVAFGALKAWGVIVGAVETIYLKWLYLQGAVTGSAMLGSLKLIGAGFVTMGTDATVGAGMVKSGMSGAAAAAGGMALAFAAAIAIGVNGWMEWNKAGEDAQRKLEDLKPPEFDNGSLSDLRRYSEILGHAYDASIDAAEGTDGFMGATRALADVMPILDNGTIGLIRDQEKASEAFENNSAQISALADAYQETWELVNDYPIEPGKHLALDSKEFKGIEKLINHLNLDPAKQTFKEMASAIKSYLKTTAEDAGYKGEAIKTAMTLSPEQLEEQKKQWQDLASAVSGTWSGQLDVVGALGAQLDVSSESIGQWYALQTIQAQTFAQNIGTAMQQGYDPMLISRLLQAGPAQAAPLLQAMVEGHKNGLVDIVNQGEAALGRLSTLAVEMARIQNLAMNAQTDDMTKNMGEGMQIAEAVSRLGAFGTAEAIKEELGIGVEKVAQIADLYGISLADAVNPILTGVGKPTITISKGTLSQSLASAGFNTGGWVDGPNVNRDVVPAMLTPGEVVVNKDMTNKWGADNLLALNAGRAPAGWQIPGFNAGGQVLLNAGRRLQDAGASITEHPAWDRVDPVHTKNSYHYRNSTGTGGDAFDANFGAGTSAREMAFFDKWAPAIRAMGLRVLWRVKDHFNHMHVDVGGGGGGGAMAMPTIELPKPPAIGGWSLAQAGEGTMAKAYAAASEFVKANSMDGFGPAGPAITGSAREIGQKMAAARGWTGGQWSALDRLWQRESGWRVNADNPTSSAYGIPQSLPGSKMASAGADWRTNPATQIAWGLDYIAGRYGSPAGAWAHSERTGWYNDGGEVFRHRRNFDRGGTLAEGWNLVNNETGAPEPLAPAGDRGPVMQVEHQHIHNGTDVDLMLQKLSRRVMAVTP